MNVTWIDIGREPRGSANPEYPDGIDLDCSGGAAVVCAERLTYPAKRCGYFVVECPTCGQRAIITTAGRPDDPRSIKLACKPVIDRIGGAMDDGGAVR